jgi:hypothetical protein
MQVVARKYFLGDPFGAFQKGVYTRERFLCFIEMNYFNLIDLMTKNIWKLQLTRHSRSKLTYRIRQGGLLNPILKFVAA